MFKHKGNKEPPPQQSLPFGMLLAELEKLFFFVFFFFLLDFIFVWIINIKFHWKRKTKLLNTKWFYLNIYLYQPFVGSVDSNGFERFPIWIYETEWLLLLNFTNDFWHYKQNFRERKYQKNFSTVANMFFFLYIEVCFTVICSSRVIFVDNHDLLSQLLALLFSTSVDINGIMASKQST